MSQPGNPPPDVPPAPARCSQCGGLGWYTEMGPNTFAQTCRACICPECICPECQGTGKTHDAYPGGWSKCERCSGTGRRTA